MNSLEKEFTLYEEALALKELGFDEPCMKEFHIQELLDNSTGCEMTNTDLVELYGEQDVIAAPTYSQAFRFFREKGAWPIETWVQPYLSANPRAYEGLYWRRGVTESLGIFNTHEEAELACLRKLIEIVK